MTTEAMQLPAGGGPLVLDRARGPKTGAGGGRGRGPSLGEGGGGGGGGRGDGPGGPNEFAGDRYQPSPPINKYTFAMVLFLCTIVMLFSGLVGSYIVFRVAAGPNWPPAGFPTLPPTLWIPTAIVVLTSLMIGLALRSARAGDQEGLRLRLGMTTLLGFAFVAAQVIIWKGLAAEGLQIRNSIYGANFYVLTGLHALHIAGGLLFLLVVLKRAFAGLYGPDAYIGVKMAAIYWHFVDALWLFLFTILYLY